MKNLFLLIIPFMLLSFKIDKPAYLLYQQNGKEIKYKKMLKELQNADIVLFGEFHNDPICHWLQLEVTKDLFLEIDSNLILGAEMFERDNQLVMNEFLAGKFNDSKFEADARLWNNYKTDYKALLNFAKENKLPFIATNVPRRYASIVYAGGFEALNELSNEAKQLFAQLPIAYDPELSCYKSMMGGGQMGGGHGNENLPKAQAIKDATMAESILNNWIKTKLFLHYNGAYHSDNFESIVWYLKKSNPELIIKTISVSYFNESDSIAESEFQKADFLIAIPESMTKTY